MAGAKIGLGWLRLLLAASSLLWALPAQSAWVAYGELRGQIGPCGCNPETDLGGIVRIGNALRDLRLANPGLVVLDLGNNSTRGTDTRKTELIYAAIQRIAPAAVLLQESELELALGMQLPLLHSHLSKALAPVRTRIETPTTVIYGLNTDLSAAMPWSAAILREWTKALEGESRQRILLARTTAPILEQIKASGLFTSIVSANPTPADAVPSPLERTQPGRLLGAAGSYRVPSFGQGILQEPGASLKQAGLAQLFAPKKPTPTPAVLDLGQPELVLWLEKSFEGAGPTTELYKKYLDSASSAFREASATRRAAFAKTSFAGAKACQSCHNQAYQVWQESKHSRAFDTLTKQAKGEQSDCVTCHVVGLDQGGFVSAAETPQLAGVQCENCHGPRLAHSRNPFLKESPRASPIAACEACHKLPHTAKFEFESYWRRIKHK